MYIIFFLSWHIYFVIKIKDDNVLLIHYHLIVICYIGKSSTSFDSKISSASFTVAVSIFQVLLYSLTLFKVSTTELILLIMSLEYSFLDSLSAKG